MILGELRASDDVQWSGIIDPSHDLFMSP